MKVYACLVGNWIDITETGTIDQRNPVLFIKEELGDYETDNCYKSFKYDYVNIAYNNSNYRIHPSMIQIVT